MTSSSPGFRNDTAGRVALLASLSKSASPCWMLARRAGLVMIVLEYCIGSQIPQ